MPTTADRAVATVRDLFAAYDAHDLPTLRSLCAPGGRFGYVPLVRHDRQRVTTTTGSIGGVGISAWAHVFHAFPDVRSDITDIFADDDGNVVAEVVISGTQAAPFGPVRAAGKTFTVPHVFRVRVDETGVVQEVVAYWDNGDMQTQLGHLELD